MSWILGILAAMVALLYGLYEAGPGMTKRREREKEKKWMDDWKRQQGMK